MISIITITYNDFEGLKRTLASIPDYDFVESVVINGGSDKATIDFLSSHKGKVINEKDEGIADAFNKGVKNSTGDAIMFLNSGDELLEPSYLEEAYNILSIEPDIDFVHSNQIFVDSLGVELFMRPPLCNLGRGMPYIHLTMIVRKKVFDQIGVFNTNYRIAMDFDFVVRLTQNGYKGRYLTDKAVVKMDGTGISVKQEWNQIKECYRSMKQNDFLSAANLFWFIIRVNLFAIRKIMLKVGFSDLLRALKEKKHSQHRTTGT